MTPEAVSPRYSGRPFSRAKLHQIRHLSAAYPAASRAQLSRLVCPVLDWKRQDCRLKEMDCRVAMRRMRCDGFLQLPPRCNGKHSGQPWYRRTVQAESDAPVRADGPRARGIL